MSMSFAEYLAGEKPDADTLHQAARYYIAEKTDYLPPDKMRERVVAAAGDSAVVQSALQQFERDSGAVQDVLFAMFNAAWEEGSEEQKRIRRSFAAARKKLPVIEVAIIAVAAMYGMYLLATGGKKEETVVNKDGSYRVTKYEPPTGPIKELGTVLKKAGGLLS